MFDVETRLLQTLAVVAVVSLAAVAVAGATLLQVVFADLLETRVWWR